MLQPKRVKHRKQHRGRRAGFAKGGTDIEFGARCIFLLHRLFPGTGGRRLERQQARGRRVGGRLLVHQGVELARFGGQDEFLIDRVMVGHPAPQAVQRVIAVRQRFANDS